MPKKLLSQLLDENGNEILYSGALVVDATTGKTFSEHVADKNAHPDFGDLAIQNKADIFADAVLTGTPVVPHRARRDKHHAGREHRVRGTCRERRARRERRDAVQGHRRRHPCVA